MCRNNFVWENKVEQKHCQKLALEKVARALNSTLEEINVDISTLKMLTYY